MIVTITNDTHLMAKQLLFLLALLCTLACNKDSVGPGVDLLYRRDFEIQTGIGPFVVHHYYLNNISSTYLQTITNQSLTDTDIKSVTNTTGEFTAIFGDARLDFITRISVRISPVGKPDEYIEVAYRDPAPLNSGTTLGLVPSLADVRSIMREDRFNVDIALETRQITTENIPVRLDLKFRAEYK
jgi:hypothetical protein